MHILASLMHYLISTFIKPKPCAMLKRLTHCKTCYIELNNTTQNKPQNQGCIISQISQETLKLGLFDLVWNI